MGSFAIHCGSTSIMSLSNIHGSVMSALLGVLVLHLSLLVLKLPPAGFYTLKEKKNPNTNYWLFMKESVCILRPNSRCQISFCSAAAVFLLYVPTWPTGTCLVLHCILSAAYGTAVLDWFVCQGTLKKVIVLIPVLVASKCMFLLKPWSISCSISNSNEQQTHSANDVRSQSSLFTRIWTASEDSWKYLKIEQIFK